jgi:carbon-monoxide dehydrogenase small subunit/xanthine dehydrogenase small subunit
MKAALDLMADSALTPIAGGTDLLVSWHHRPKDDLALLDLSLLPELRALRLTDEFLELGGGATYWQVIESAEISRAFPLLAQAARQVGAIQIQTRGTWAGNIANGSPAADGVPVMMAYDAVVVLQSSDGTIEVPLDQYYTGYKQSVRRPEQLIRAIRMPRRQREFEWFHKVGARSAQAITKVGAAMAKDAHGWRVVANSVAPTVVRCRTFEAALDAGQSFASPAEIADLLKPDISPIDDLRSTAEYRNRVLSRLIYFRLDEREKRKEKREK